MDPLPRIVVLLHWDESPGLYRSASRIVESLYRSSSRIVESLYRCCVRVGVSRRAVATSSRPLLPLLRLPGEELMLRHHLPATVTRRPLLPLVSSPVCIIIIIVSASWIAHIVSLHYVRYPRNNAATCCFFVKVTLSIAEVDEVFGMTVTAGG